MSWDVNGTTGYGTSPLAPTLVSPNLENIVGFTRGGGVTTSGTAATGGWGGTGWKSAIADAKTDNSLITLGFKPKAGFAVSLTSIEPFSYRRSTAGPTNGLLEYSLNEGTSYSGISQGAFALGSTSTNGAGVTPPISLNLDADLQNVQSGIGFRIIPYGATSSTGTFYIYNVFPTGDDFSVNGRILGTTQTSLSSTACKNLSGTAQTFIVKGDGLTTSNVTVTAPANFEISTDDVTYLASLTLTPSGGSVNQQCYVRLKSGLADGSYSGNVTVTGGGFTSAANLGVALTGTVYALPTAVVNPIFPVCAGDAFPTVSVGLTGASPWNVTYTDGTTPTTIPAAATSPLEIMSTTNGQVFTVTALTDANGCVAGSGDLTGSATVVVNPVPEVSVTATNGASTGAAGMYNQGETISITATIDVGSGAYSWSGPDGFMAGDEATVTVPSATSAKAGTYTVTVTDGNNCVGTADVEVIVYDNTIYVSTTGDNANTGSAASPLQTIQKAVDVAAATNTIEVAAGTYAEKININKSVTLKGANFGTAGCASGRSSETSIAGDASNNPSVTVSADGVTIDGFNVTGFDGVSANGFKNLHIKNNLLTVDRLGINAGAVATSAGNTITISDNCVNLNSQLIADPALPTTVGLFLNSVSGSVPMVVSNNSVSGGFYGYLLHNFKTTPVSIINGGSITGVLKGIAAVNTLNGTNLFPSAFDVDGVTMSGFAGTSPDPATNSHAGLYTFTGGSSTAANGLTINVRNSDIQGTGKPDAASAGINASDFSAGAAIVQNITVDKSVVSNNANRGVNVRGKSIVTITNSTLEGNGNNAFGSDGNDGFTFIARNGAQLAASNNFVKHPATSATPVTAFSSASGANVITANNNSVLMNGNASGKGAGASSGVINATCNWWGGIAGTVAPLMSGNVNFELFLVDGTDDDGGTTGFQPAPNSCKGCSSGLSVANGVGKFFCSIQTAVDDPTTLDGQTLTVGPGTYNESVIVTKSLTILGPNNAISPNTGTRVDEAVLVNSAGNRAFSIYSGNTDVTISGFKFDGGSPIHDGNDTGNPNTSDVTFSKNIVVNGNQIYAGTSTSWADLLITDNKFKDINATATSNAMQVSHTLTTTITNNAFVNVNYAAMAIDATPTINISGNTIDGTGFQAIQLAGAIGDATVENNKISDANRVAQAADRGAIRLYGSGFTGVVKVSNNEITGGYNGITVRNGENITGKNITITENSITGLTDGKAIFHGGTGVLSATCNWFGTADPLVIDSKIVGDVNFLPFTTNGTDDQPTTTGFQPVAGSCDGVGPVKNADTGDSFFAIQEAIDDADTDNGDVIEVAAGTYTENVLINKQLTINGANVGSTCNGSRGAESIVSVTAGIPFTITADNVTVNGFDITAPASRNAIVVGNVSNATVRFNKVHDVGTTFTGGNVHAIIHIVPGTPVANLTISDNCIDDISSTNLTNYSSSAIGVLQSTSSGVLTGLNIERNVINNVIVNGGNWPTGKIAYGIQINVGGNGSYLTNTGKVLNAKINNNEISNLSGHIATAIALEGNTENAEVKNNSVTNLTSTKSADRAGGGYDLNGLKFENNRFVSSVTVENNSFATNTFSNNGNANLGYAVVNYVAGSTATLACNWFGTAVAGDIEDKTDLSGKVLSKSGADISFEPYLTSAGDGAGVGFQPTGNCDGSAIAIVSIVPTAATCNAAGSAVVTFSGGTAPVDISWTDGGTNAGSAAGVSSPYTINGLAAATYTVTITDANASTAGQSTTVGFMPVSNVTSGMNYATIQAAIDAASANDVIKVCKGTYTGNLTINNALTVNGANVGTAGTGIRTDESVLLNSKVTISGSGAVVLDGFKIMRDDATAGDVILVGGNTPTTITNNILERNGSVAGINVRAIVTAAGTAIKTIGNNLFTGDGSNLFGSHKTWNNGIYVNGATGPVNIEGNRFENTRSALNLDDYQTGISVSGNTFTNNGTHVSFGGTTPTAGSFLFGANDFGLSGSAIFNLSNVNENFRLDVTSSNYKGTALASVSDADLFEFESQLFHKDRSGRKGKVIYRANNQYVNNITTPFTKIDGIQASVKYADANDIINLQAGTYNQRVVIDKSDVTLQGVTADETLYKLDGTGLTGSGDGIQLVNGAKNVGIKQLTIQNFAGANGNSDAGIYAIGGNDGIVVDDVVIKNNVGGSGFYANGPVDGVTITNSKIEGHTVGARGIVVWNGFKQNITITGNTLTNNNCCGIELQDGTASAVTISDNIIDIGTGDNAIGLTSLNGLTGANLIDNNTITGGGRFGIEVKNPAGDVTVSNNSVTLTTQNADVRDRAGIAVFRRGFIAGQGYANIPNGVTLTANTVSGYRQASTSEGFGIVVEGTNHTLTNNILTNNDIGIQQQAGHTPYTANAAGDGDQSNLADLYFGRGNSPELCNITLTGNTYSTNGVDERIVTGGGTGTIVSAVTPTVDDPADVTACNGGTIPTITFTGNNLPGVVYNWTNDNTNVGIAATGSGDIASVSAVNATASPIVANVTVTPTVNGCAGAAQTFIITVNPTPTATIAGDATVCLDATEPTITFTGGNATEPYTFTYKINGGSDQQITTTTGNSVTLTVSTASVNTFVYELTAVSVGTTCSATITGQTATVTVNDKATVTAGTYSAICKGGSIALTGSFSGAASSIMWSDGSVGGSFAPNANDPAATYTPPANYMGTITLTITSDDPAGPCPAATATASLVVNDVPVVSIASVTPICEGESITFNASVSGDAVGVTYSWSGPGTYTSTAQNPTITNATIANAGTYTLMVTNANGCTGMATVNVVVYSKPAAPAITSDNPEICKGTNAVLSASCAVSTDIFRWSTPPINQGNNTSALSSTGTQTITKPGTYTGYCESVDGCAGPLGSVTIIEGTNCDNQRFITVVPEIPAICPGGSISVTASGCSGTVSWISPNGSVTGTTVTLSPAVTTTYLVSCSTGGSTTVDVTVAKTNVVVANNITTGKALVKAVQTIESNKRIGDPNVTPAPNVIYEAGNSILLNPGFVAEGRAIFKAEIKGCN